MIEPWELSFVWLFTQFLILHRYPVTEWPSESFVSLMWSSPLGNTEYFSPKKVNIIFFERLKQNLFIILIEKISKIAPIHTVTDYFKGRIFNPRNNRHIRLNVLWNMTFKNSSAAADHIFVKNRYFIVLRHDLMEIKKKHDLINYSVMFFCINITEYKFLCNAMKY